AVGILAPDTVGSDQLGQDAQAEKLHSHDQQGDRVEEHRAIADRSETKNPEDGQVAKPQHSQAQERKARSPQDVQRPLSEPGQEPYRQEIEEALEEPRHVILRGPMPPESMVHLDLGDTKSAGMSQHRHEPVQLAVDLHLANDLAAVQLETATVVMKMTAAQHADHPVENPAGINLVPRIAPVLLPAANDVVPLLEPGQKPGNLGRIVLKIGIESEYPFTLCRAKARG